MELMTGEVVCHTDGIHGFLGDDDYDADDVACV